MTTRKKYSKELNLDAVSLVIDQGYTRKEAGRSLDINANMLGRWVKELHALYQDSNEQSDCKKNEPPYGR